MTISNRASSQAIREDKSRIDNENSLKNLASKDWVMNHKSYHFSLAGTYTAKNGTLVDWGTVTTNIPTANISLDAGSNAALFTQLDMSGFNVSVTNAHRDLFPLIVVFYATLDGQKLKMGEAKLNWAKFGEASAINFARITDR